MYRNSDPVGSASGLTGCNGWWNGGGLLGDVVVDGHNFSNGWWLLDGVVGVEDFVVGVIPSFGMAVPGKGLLQGVVSKSGFCDKIDT